MSWLKSVFAVGALAATAVFLIATSREPCARSTAAQTVAFSVTGSCGESPRAVITALSGRCDFTLTGAQGLPTTGEIGMMTSDVRRGGWALFGGVVVPLPPDAGVDGGDPRLRGDGGIVVNRSCLARDGDGGIVLLDCTTSAPGVDCTATMVELP